jgi:hypothetical protein
LLRDDGGVDRVRGTTVYPGDAPATDAERYSSVGAGVDATYLLRSDGTVDRSRVWGKVANSA